MHVLHASPPKFLELEPANQTRAMFNINVQCKRNGSEHKQ